MATYVISDIHGYLSRMFKVLEIAKFDWDNDELYILGDIIDRGPESAEALEWAIEEAPSNIHFLLGNHEDMAYSALMMTRENGVSYDFFDDPWSWNGGSRTLEDCLKLRGYKWCHKAAEWIRELPLYYIVDDKLLVHAGICNGTPSLSDDFIRNGIDEYIDIPGIRRPQWSQHLLWIRDRWIRDQNSYPYDIIFGHTPTTYDWMQIVNDCHNFNRERSPIACQGRPGYIVRMVGFDNYKVRYCIDTGRDRMGLLRLDDYAEFYATGD